MGVHRQQTRSDLFVESVEILIELVSDSLDCPEQPPELMLQPVETGIHRVEPRVDALKSRVDSVFESLETCAHTFVKGGDRHSKAADHSIV